MKFNWQEISREAAKSIVEFPGEAIEILRTPQDDPRTTILVLSILAVGLLLLAILGFFIFSLVRARRQVEPVMEEPIEGPIPPPESPEPTRRPREDWIGIGLFVVAVIALLAIASYQISLPSFCANCHIVKTEYKSWMKSSHRQVGCLACHQEPGISGYVVQKIGYVREVFLFATGNYGEPMQSVVTNRSCNRCHRNLARETIVRYGIKVKHRNFLEKGYRCVGCHNTTAHGDNVPVPKYPTMDKCVVCHDGKELSADCKFCHVSTVAKQVRQPRRELVKIATQIPWSCRGCHSPQLAQKCIDCHGLEMPHSPEFMTGKHARSAFTERQVCLKCHFSEVSFCNECHVYPSPHGPASEWIKQHGSAAKKQTIVQVALEDSQFVDCYLCHRGKGYNMCDACHVGQKETTMEEVRAKEKAAQESAKPPSGQQPISVPEEEE